MTEAFAQMVLLWPGDGWLLLAVFLDMGVCRQVAELMGHALALEVRCVVGVGL